jgi:hypothetical protein
MCDECSKGLAGKPKKAKIGYAEGGSFDKIEDKLKNHFWDGLLRAGGTTAGYVSAKVAEESSDLMSQNKGIAAVAQIGTGMTIKAFIPAKNADNLLDTFASGVITRGSVNLFRGLAEGFANKYNIHGQPFVKRFRGFVPSMPKMQN